MSLPFRQLLTDASQNLDLEQWDAAAAALGWPGAAAVSIRQQTLHGGRQEGVRLLTVNNGCLAVTVIPTRGMGILKVEAADLRLAWNSPVHEVVHPHFINLESRGGLGWLQGFNEWLVRCGLESAGAPGRDEFTTNTGDRAEMNLTLHGKIANIPASKVEVLVDADPPYRLRVRGRVDEFMFYGPKLELWTEISMEPNAAGFRIADTITNRGAADQEFELIYHINFGPPLLEAGSRFLGAMQQITPINAQAARALNEYETFRGPTAGFVEQVYCMQPVADSAGRTMVMLQNAAGDRAMALGYPVSQLPCFTLWKNTNHLDEGYVTGLEPGTNFPNNRRVEREGGRLSKLAPGQSRHFALDVALHSGKEAVSKVAAQIASLRS